jgi:heme-degrading monooxygenase HmoA
MFARVSIYDIGGGRMDDAVTSFRSALEEISRLEGFSEGFFIASGEDEHASAITLWTSRTAMEASRTAASRLRTEAAEWVEGSVVSACEYEVAVHVVGPQ